jgi:hypothetical protein
MLSNTLAIQFLLGVAGLTQAQSPPNIFPQVNNNLAIQYNGQAINPGQTLATQGLLSVHPITYDDANKTKLLCHSQLSELPWGQQVSTQIRNTCL